MNGEHASDFHIRTAHAGDLDALVEFNTALARETEGRRLEHELLRDGVASVLSDAAKGLYMVMEHRPTDRVIGQLMITFEWSDWRNRVFWWLQSVYVHKDWRRRGVCKTLYGHVVREAERRGNVAGIRLYVEQDNRIAQTVYGRLGLSPPPYRVFEKDFVLPAREGE